MLCNGLKGDKTLDGSKLRSDGYKLRSQVGVNCGEIGIMFFFHLRKLLLKVYAGTLLIGHNSSTSSTQTQLLTRGYVHNANTRYTHITPANKCSESWILDIDVLRTPVTSLDTWVIMCELKIRWPNTNLNLFTPLVTSLPKFPSQCNHELITVTIYSWSRRFRWLQLKNNQFSFWISPAAMLHYPSN